MYAVLNLTWTPDGGASEPPDGQGPAIVRGDTYIHTYRIIGGAASLAGATFNAQLRPEKLSGPGEDEPTAAFDVDAVENGDDLDVTIRLEADITLVLPRALMWDLEMTNDGDITTCIAGKATVVDHVTHVDP